MPLTNSPDVDQLLPKEAVLPTLLYQSALPVAVTVSSPAASAASALLLFALVTGTRESPRQPV